jgi:hypothetical protein
MDDEANEAVYGRDTTPRMILEGRANARPSNAIVDFRDRLEEATALARSNRGTTQTQAPVATSQPAPTTTAPLSEAPAEAQPTPFEPVSDVPTTPEPLPETP